MSNLIILRGNSGSGKTTLSKQIQKKIGKNTLLIPQDTVRREMLNAKDGADYFDIPFEETMKRHQERHISSFGKEKMRSWWLEKDYIGFIPEKKFTIDMSLEDELEVVMNDVVKR